MHPLCHGQWLARLWLSRRKVNRKRRWIVFAKLSVPFTGKCNEWQLGEWPKDNNPLKNAPHTASVLISDKWSAPYSREEAAYPVPRLHKHKWWPYVGRIDGVYGDRNLICSCPICRGNDVVTKTSLPPIITTILPIFRKTSLWQKLKNSRQ